MFFEQIRALSLGIREISSQLPNSVLVTISALDLENASPEITVFLSVSNFEKEFPVFKPIFERFLLKILVGKRCALGFTKLVF